jgi:hypothetical protein
MVDGGLGNGDIALSVSRKTEPDFRDNYTLNQQARALRWPITIRFMPWRDWLNKLVTPATGADRALNDFSRRP